MFDMARCRQGELWWAQLPEPGGRRPVLILTRTKGLAQLQNVTVAPVTRTIRDIESEVVLSDNDGVPTTCAVSLDNILTIRKSTLERRIATLTTARMLETFQAIRFAFAMR